RLGHRGFCRRWPVGARSCGRTPHTPRGVDSEGGEVLDVKGRAVRGVVHGLAVGGTVVCMATACTLAGQAPGPGGDEHGPKIVITPESGTDDVVPNTPVRVAVEKGAVSDVRVEQRPLDGTSKDGRSEEHTSELQS